MVLCQYYLNNRCQFGSKCHNEHFDIRQTIKSEIEAALKGTQWPLSCFGPFKEKPSLQNFITDQSFEEVRYMCYEAKKQNTFPAYSQQFSQEVMNAKNKMNSMLSLSRDVVEAVVNLYNSSPTEQSGGNNQGQKSNPFAVAAVAAVQNNNSNSIFGNSAAPVNNPFASSGYGNPAQNAANVFGGSQPTVTTTTGTSGGMFGQSAFGGGSSNAFGSTNNSVFGGGQPQPLQQPSNVFSLPQVGGAQPANQSGNAFGMAAQPNAFGAAPNTNLFVSQNQTPQQGMFAQQNSQMQSVGIFGPAGQQQPQNLAFVQTAQPTNLFGNQQPAANVFGQPNAVASQGQGIFGNSVAPPAANQQPGIFGGQHQMQTIQQQPIGFGPQPGNNVFGTSQQQPQQIQQPNTVTPENVFGAQTNFQQLQQQQQPNTGQPFGGGVPNTPMGDGPITDNYIPVTAYSKMEDLTPEVLEAFNAPEFVLGKLPTVPPPRELC